MTLFRSEVAEQPVNNMVTEDNRIAFSRGRRGFFALNNDGKYSWVRTVQTGLRPGVYCDMITGEVAGPGCTGKSVIVNKDGTVNLFLRSGRVMAISTASMISLPRAFKHTIVFIRKETSYGQHVFLRGGIMKHIAPVCKSLDTAASAIPIVHVGEATMEDKEFKQWSKNDIYLNWHGSEPMQGEYDNKSAIGSPMLWTSDNNLDKSFNPYNKYGNHFWMFDVMMDCSKTTGGWFEFKAITDGLEESTKQTKCVEKGDVIKLPYGTEDNLGRCGYLNVYDFSQPFCKFEKI
ncbi:alpha amylase, all-beta domain protein [Trichuris suis]|nr:alpha amylase, all-beta domain protein [Trichuris suis]